MRREQFFDNAFEELIDIERGYVDDPLDNGGETKYGVSKRSYPYLDIKNLTLCKAKGIYKRDYWALSGADRIDDYQIALELFDTGVNMGVYMAKIILQRSLNIMNRNEQDYKDIGVDGDVGPKTMGAYAIANKKTLLKVMNGYQFMRYVEITESNPAQERFFNGWMKRV